MGRGLVTYLDGVVAVIHVGEGHSVDFTRRGRFRTIVVDFASSSQSSHCLVIIDGFSGAQADMASSYEAER